MIWLNLVSKLAIFRAVREISSESDNQICVRDSAAQTRSASEAISLALRVCAA